MKIVSATAVILLVVILGGCQTNEDTSYQIITQMNPKLTLRQQTTLQVRMVTRTENTPGGETKISHELFDKEYDGWLPAVQDKAGKWVLTERGKEIKEAATNSYPNPEGGGGC